MATNTAPIKFQGVGTYRLLYYFIILSRPLRTVNGSLFTFRSRKRADTLSVFLRERIYNQSNTVHEFYVRRKRLSCAETQWELYTVTDGVDRKKGGEVFRNRNTISCAFPNRTCPLAKSTFPVSSWSVKTKESPFSFRSYDKI